MSDVEIVSLSVQVWRDGEKFTGYSPVHDVTVTSESFDLAVIETIEACKKKGQVDVPTPIKELTIIRWDCICGHNNPDGRVNCASCGSIRM